MRILFIGDIFGRPGRDIAQRAIKPLVATHDIDLVVANVENSAAGFGVTGDIADAILKFGVDVMTSGNHIWDKKEVLDYIPRQPKLLRPANYPAGVPGRGTWIGQSHSGIPVAVINVMGRIFMAPLEDPFAVVLREIDAARAKAKVIVVDFHAEATSEKVAMGWHLDGKVTAVFGTHTHVPTADEQILPGGTAFVCDVGMTGPYDGILGRKYEPILSATMSNVPVPFDVASGDVRLGGAIVEIDTATGCAIRIERVMIREDRAAHGASLRAQ